MATPPAADGRRPRRLLSAAIPTSVAVTIGAGGRHCRVGRWCRCRSANFPEEPGTAAPEQVARALAHSTDHLPTAVRLADLAVRPVVQPVAASASIEPVHDVEHSAIPRDLEHIIAASREAGDIPRDLSALLDRILDFLTSTAEHATISSASRVDVVAADEPVEEVLARMATGTPATRSSAPTPTTFGASSICTTSSTPPRAPALCRHEVPAGGHRARDVVAAQCGPPTRRRWRRNGNRDR